MPGGGPNGRREAPPLDRPAPGLDLSGHLLDLNLLRVLDVLLEERSVTRAGARLELTQSAVSHALGRLRHILGDDLFRRTGQGLQPTPRAIEIAPALHTALGRLQGALEPASFDPATCDRRLRVVADASASALLIPALALRVRVLAPNMRLHISQSALDLAPRLDAGEVDFVLGAIAASPERFAREPLRREAMAWIVRADHPLAEGPATLEAIMAGAHVAVASPRAPAGSPAVMLQSSWEDADAVAADLARLGLRRQIFVVTPDYCSVRVIVMNSDMVGLAPCRLALAWGQSDRLRVEAVSRKLISSFSTG